MYIATELAGEGMTPNCQQLELQLIQSLRDIENPTATVPSAEKITSSSYPLSKYSLFGTLLLGVITKQVFPDLDIYRFHWMFTSIAAFSCH